MCDQYASATRKDEWPYRLDVKLNEGMENPMMELSKLVMGALLVVGCTKESATVADLEAINIMPRVKKGETASVINGIFGREFGSVLPKNRVYERLDDGTKYIECTGKNGEVLILVYKNEQGEIRFIISDLKLSKVAEDERARRAAAADLDAL